MADSPFQISKLFPYQSFFSTTALETAIQPQGAGQAIVSNAAAPAEDVNIPGYGVALSPDSETPVAIEFRRSMGQSSSAMILRPGQVMFPFGRQEGDDAFSGFKWGLPAGWLGGGQAGLMVLRSPRAELHWLGRPEVVFHRQTLDVLAVGAVVVPANVFPNWPCRFPSYGTRITAPSGILGQGGAPIVAVEPSKTLLRLVTTTQLTKPSTVRFFFLETKEFDLSSAGVLGITAVAYEDVTFPVYLPGGLFGLNPMPVEVRNDGPLARLGIDPTSAGQTSLGVVAADVGDGDDLSTAFVQVVRYGRL